MRKTFQLSFIFIIILMFISIIFAIGFHTADEIIDGNFNGNFHFNGTVDFSQANIIITQTEVEEFPIGSIMTFAGEVIPVNWSECDGKFLNRNDYTELFNIIGITFGNDSSNTFAIPDLRGEFVRGFDDGRGVDNGRVFGSFQNHQFQTHTHSVSHNAVKSYLTNTGYWYDRARRWSDPGPAMTVGNPNSGNYGVETRPRNVALKYIIKIK